VFDIDDGHLKQSVSWKNHKTLELVCMFTLNCLRLLYGMSKITNSEYYTEDHDNYDKTFKWLLSA